MPLPLPSQVSLNPAAIQSWDPLVYETTYLGWCLSNLREPFLPKALGWIDESWFSSVNHHLLYLATVQVALEASTRLGLHATTTRVANTAEQLSHEPSGWAQAVVDSCLAAEQQVCFDLPGLAVCCVAPWRIVRGKPAVQRAIAEVDALLANRNPPVNLSTRVESLLREAAGAWNCAIHQIDPDAPISPEQFLSESLTPPDPTKPLAIPTGLQCWDGQLQGIATPENPVCGRLITVAARPGVGKTAFAASIAHGVASHGGHVAFISLEVGVRQILARLCCIYDWHQHVSRDELVELEQFATRSFTTEQISRLRNYAHAFANGISIADNLVGLEQITAHLRLLKSRDPLLRLAVIDHLGLIGLPKADTQAVAIGMATRQIKLLAVELGIDVLLACQLNRGLERRADTRPVLSDLRDSGRIEEDSDCVLALSRNVNGDWPDRLSVAALKNRHGPVSTAAATFHLRHGVVANQFPGLA